MTPLETEIEIYLKRRAIKAGPAPTRREIVNRFANCGAEAVSAALASLERLGVIRSRSEPGRQDGRGGRPRIRYEIL